METPHIRIGNLNKNPGNKFLFGLSTQNLKNLGNPDKKPGNPNKRSRNQKKKDNIFCCMDFRDFCLDFHIFYFDFRDSSKKKTKKKII
jgi:hypothetical protein